MPKQESQRAFQAIAVWWFQSIHFIEQGCVADTLGLSLLHHGCSAWPALQDAELCVVTHSSGEERCVIAQSHSTVKELH